MYLGGTKSLFHHILRLSSPYLTPGPFYCFSIFFSNIFQLEEGNGRKWFYDLGSKSLSSIQKEHASVWEKKENAPANIEHSANEIMFLTRGEVDRMKRTAEEQARSIEEMKKEQVAATGKFEETIEETSQKFEELRSLVTNPSAIINHRPNLDVSHARAGHSTRQSQRMRRSMFVRTPSALLESHESISLDWDTFSLMMISPVCSKAWILGFVSPLLKYSILPNIFIYFHPHCEI